MVDISTLLPMDDVVWLWQQRKGKHGTDVQVIRATVYRIVRGKVVIRMLNKFGEQVCKWVRPQELRKVRA